MESRLKLVELMWILVIVSFSVIFSTEKVLKLVKLV